MINIVMPGTPTFCRDDRWITQLNANTSEQCAFSDLPTLSFATSGRLELFHDIGCDSFQRSAALRVKTWNGREAEVTLTVLIVPTHWFARV
jgi:hypothetical protein